MTKLAAAIGAFALAIVSTPAVAAVVVPHVRVAIPHVNTSVTNDKFYAAPGHNPAFEIKSFSFGVENPTTVGSATGGAGTGKIKLNDIKVTKSVKSAACRHCPNLVVPATK